MLRLITSEAVISGREMVKAEKPATTLQELVDLWFGMDEGIRAESRYSGLISGEAVGYFQYHKFELLQSLLHKLDVIEYQFKNRLLPSINRDFFEGFLHRFYIEVDQFEYKLKDNLDINGHDYLEGRFCAEEALGNFSALYQAYLTNNCILKAFCTHEMVAVGDPRLDLSEDVRNQVVRILSCKYPDPMLESSCSKKAKQEQASTVAVI